jgi:hypothetical protein
VAEETLKTALAGIIVLVAIVGALVYFGGPIQGPTSDGNLTMQNQSQGEFIPQSRTAGSFSLTVSPLTVTAHPGDTIRYLVTVKPENGFEDPVHLAISATALNGAVGRSSDLGMIGPPYRAVTRDIVVPDLPPLVSGTTVDATLTATGGGITRTEHLQLVIET